MFKIGGMLTERQQLVRIMSSVFLMLYIVMSTSITSAFLLKLIQREKQFRKSYSDFKIFYLCNSAFHIYCYHHFYHYCYGWGRRGGGGGREREREADRQTDTDRQRDRQTDSQSGRQRHRLRDRDRE